MDDRKTIENMRSLLGVISKALQTKQYRNTYEANNAIASNQERLQQAEQGLTIIGAHVHRTVDEEEAVLELKDELKVLKAKWEDRQREVKKGGLVGGGNSSAVGMGATTASEEEWLRQMQEEDTIAVELEKSASNQSKKTSKKDKKSKKEKKKAGGSGAAAQNDGGDGAYYTKETQRDFKNEKVTHGMERGSSLAHLMHPTSNGDLSEAVQNEICTIKPKHAGRVSPQPGQHHGGLGGMYVDSVDDVATSGGTNKKGGKSASGSSSPQGSPFTTYETHKNILFGALPQPVLRGPCEVVPIENSPLVELRFLTGTPGPSTPNASPMTGEDSSDDGPNELYVHVTMYRVVMAALWRGVPEYKYTGPLKQAGSPSASKRSTPPPQHSADSAEGADGEDFDDENLLIVSSDDESGDERGVSKKAMERITSFASSTGDDEYDVLQELSQKLVHSYLGSGPTQLGLDDNSGQISNVEDDEQFFLSTGRDMPQGTIRNDLSHFTGVSTKTWCILMCHGGYFAGAIYENTKPIIHKAFHRYVIRKKQGGKQSSHDKGGGSQLSAGGQIRRHNELKWKQTVRNILCDWREHIDKAWMILYVAPGPDNRNILTDFSALPVSLGGGPQGEKSPIDMKDPRVRSVPMTTHRPTFKEVQRIYETCSKCTVRYVHKNDDDMGGSPREDQ